MGRLRQAGWREVGWAVACAMSLLFVVACGSDGGGDDDDEEGFRGLTVGNGLFVAVGTEGIIDTSTDGTQLPIAATRASRSR